MNEEDKFCISNRNWIGLMKVEQKKIRSEKTSQRQIKSKKESKRKIERKEMQGFEK